MSRQDQTNTSSLSLTADEELNTEYALENVGILGKSGP